jgi:hypothetical protein
MLSALRDAADATGSGAERMAMIGTFHVVDVAVKAGLVATVGE